MPPVTLSPDPWAIAELLSAISRRARSRAFARGLNPAQWAALRYFGRANPTARTLTGFWRAYQSTQGTATVTVALLVRKGYLVRKMRGDDKRSARLDLTPAGRAMLRRDPMNDLVQAIESLRPRERRSLADGLVALNLAYNGDVRAP